MVSALRYYESESDALANINVIGTSFDMIVDTVGTHSSWKIASNSTGSSPQSGVYNTGVSLINDGFYLLYPNAACLLEGSTILCLIDGVEKYIPIQDIRKGTLVKTSNNEFKHVESIGCSRINNPGNSERIKGRLYICTKEAYPNLTADLILTGCHSLLVDHFTSDQREKTLNSLGDIFSTDGKYRLNAWIDERAKPWASEGEYTIWHLSLETSNIYVNFGIYANGGLLVETASINTLKNKSHMKLL